MDTGSYLDYYLGHTKRTGQQPTARVITRSRPEQHAQDATNAMLDLAKAAMILGFASGAAGMLARR
jgi:hypothetical protein